MLKVLDRLEEWLIAFLMAGATLVIFASVVHRYASGYAIPYVQDFMLKLNMSWAQELCIYMFVWMAKFGAAYGVRTGIHVGVDVLINRLNARVRGGFIIFGLLAGAFFTGTVGTFGAKFVYQLAHSAQTTPDLEVPVWIVYLAIPCGSYLMCFRFLQVAWAFWQTGELPRHDHAHVGGMEETESLPAIPQMHDPIHPEGTGHPAAGRRRCPPVNTAILFILLISLMLTGMPISISLGLTVLTYLFAFTQVPIESVALKLFTGIEKFEIMAIPFFILAGNFLTYGGVAARMIRFATSMIGHWHGGLALAGVVACAMFALVCGSSVATVVAIGSIILPEMVKAGYPMRFGAGVITVAGSLGILMLPSIPKVIYAVATGTSIGALFIAGLIPGIVLTTMICGVTWYLAKKRGYPRLPRATWGQAWRAFRDSIWGLMLVVIIIGGIYSGIFTATEAAAMSAVYAFIVSVFIYRAMPLRDLKKVLLQSANMSAMLLYIITNAALFSFILTNENIPQALAGWILNKHLGWIGFLLIANLMLLVAGNFMEPSSIILIMAPILYPAAMALGINPVHLGILIDVNMEVGLCHPPVGLNLYVASGISRLGITELTKAVMPWLLTLLVFLVIVTYWPELTLCLPRWLHMVK